MAPHQCLSSKCADDSSCSYSDRNRINRPTSVLQFLIWVLIMANYGIIDYRFLFVSLNVLNIICLGRPMVYDFTQHHIYFLPVSPCYKILQPCLSLACRGLHEIVVLKPSISHSRSYANYTTNQFATASCAVKDTNDFLIRGIKMCLSPVMPGERENGYQGS